MLAETCLRRGELQTALEALQEDVRRAPSDFKLRVFLFQLLVVLGQWERAVKQLQVAASLDAEALPMAQAYRELIRCELVRAEVFLGARAPNVLTAGEPWIELLIAALADTAGGEHAAAEALRSQALEQAPARAGSLADEPFAWLADADSRLGPVLEVVVRGHYAWVPFAALKRLELEAPTDLRDLVWLPGKLELTSGEVSECFIPTRYPGSERSSDDAVRLARKTEWRELSDGTACGLGQRLLVTDRGEYGLLEQRALTFATGATEPEVAVGHG